jgi:hypothetical protein
MSIIDRLSRIDKRAMYWTMLLLIALPYARPLGLPMQISTYSTEFKTTIDGLAKGDVVLVSMDIGLGSISELGGGVIALAKQLSAEGVKVVAVSTVAEGPLVFDQYFKPVLESAGYRYGVDYINLGYAAGDETMIARIAEDISSVYTIDYSGNKVASLPLVQSANTYASYRLVVTFDAGTATGFYARQWQAKYGTTILSVPTAVNFSYFFPLYQAGSVKAILNGPRGCAEYEQLIGAPGMANQGIDALSMGQLVVIGFMLLGNVAFIGDRIRRRAQ